MCGYSMFARASSVATSPRHQWSSTRIAANSRNAAPSIRLGSPSITTCVGVTPATSRKSVPAACGPHEHDSARRTARPRTPRERLVVGNEHDQQATALGVVTLARRSRDGTRRRRMRALAYFMRRPLALCLEKQSPPHAVDPISQLVRR